MSDYDRWLEEPYQEFYSEEHEDDGFTDWDDEPPYYPEDIEYDYY
jgi:hypothetical protein